jgi:hypothetical protein
MLDDSSCAKLHPQLLTAWMLLPVPYIIPKCLQRLVLEMSRNIQAQSLGEEYVTRTQDLAQVIE